MEQAEEADVDSQELWMASEFKQRRGTGAEEQVVEQPFTLEAVTLPASYFAARRAGHVDRMVTVR